MKQLKLMLNLICIGLLFIPIRLSSLETKLSGEFWGRWISEIAKQKDSEGNYEDKLVSTIFPWKEVIWVWKPNFPNR